MTDSPDTIVAAKIIEDVSKLKGVDPNKVAEMAKKLKAGSMTQDDWRRFADGSRPRKEVKPDAH
ncbi:MAG: hypothetical protein AB1714_16060 [Acidobacteriota bacterium]